jgi:hypothetical protein
VDYVPRPSPLVSGLVVTLALQQCGASEEYFVQPVECFMYPGSGQTVATGQVSATGPTATRYIVPDLFPFLLCARLLPYACSAA